jgi:hypothetical protein
VIQDLLGRALLDASNAYLVARQPTAQLTHNLVDALAKLIAQRTGEQVCIKIGSVPPIVRKP